MLRRFRLRPGHPRRLQPEHSRTVCGHSEVRASITFTLCSILLSRSQGQCARTPLCPHFFSVFSVIRFHSLPRIEEPIPLRHLQPRPKQLAQHRRRQQLRLRPIGHYPPRPHQDHPLDLRQNVRYVVRNQQDTSPLLRQPPQHLPQVLLRRQIQRVRRLIQQQHLVARARLGASIRRGACPRPHQRPPNHHPPLLSRRHLPHRLVPDPPPPHH